MYETHINDGILKFDMQYFLSPDNPQNENGEYGAILLITANQMILALNAGNGDGSHDDTLAEAMHEIYEIPIDNSNGTLMNLSKIAQKKIHARLVNEKKGLGTKIIFPLYNIENISKKEFEMFKKFYDKYNEIIKNMSYQYREPIVIFRVKNNDKNIINKHTGKMKKFIEMECDDLTPLLTALEKLVDINKKDEEEKNNIEISNEQKSNIYKNELMKKFKDLLKSFEEYQQYCNNQNEFSIYEQQIKVIENEILEKSHDGFTLMEAKNIINSIDILVKNINSSILTQSENQQNEVNKNSK